MRVSEPRCLLLCECITYRMLTHEPFIESSACPVNRSTVLLCELTDEKSSVFLTSLYYFFQC